MKHLLITTAVAIASLCAVNTASAGLFDKCGSCATAVRSCVKSTCSCVRTAKCCVPQCKATSCKKSLSEKLKGLVPRPTPAPQASLVNSLPVQLQTQSQPQSGTRTPDDRMSELERRMTRLEGIVVGMEKSLTANQQNVAKTVEILNGISDRIGAQN